MLKASAYWEETPAGGYRNIIYKVVDKAPQLEVYDVEGKRFLRLTGNG